MFRTVLVLFGIAVAQLFSTCVFQEYPSFDVPYCTTPASCFSKVGFRDQYAHYVSKAWYYSNRAIQRVDAARRICSGVLDLNEIVDQLSSLSSQLGSDTLFALKASDTANYVAINRLTAIYDELNYAGISCLSGGPLVGVQNAVNSALLSVKSRSPSDPVGRAVLSLESRKGLWEDFGLVGSVILQIASPVVGFVLGWSPLKVTSIHALSGLTSSIVRGGIGAEEYINKSVGMHDSLYSAVSPIFVQYYRAVDSMDREVDKLEKETLKLRKEIMRDAEVFSTPVVLELDGNALSRFIPKKVVVSYLPADLDEFYRTVDVETAALERKILQLASEYRSRKERYLCAYSRIKTLYDDMLRIKDEVESRKNALSQIAKKCEEYLSSYDPFTEFCGRKIEGIVSVMKKSETVEEKLSLCSEGVRIALIDETYRDEKELLEACERRAEQFFDYNCGGDLLDRLECCRSFLKRKETELMSSEEFRKYQEILSKIGNIVSFLGGEGLKDYVRLKTFPSSREELQKYFYRALDTYQKLLKKANKIAPNIYFEGYLDAHEISEINMVVYYGINADLVYKGTLPFSVYAYRVLESNGMNVSVSENKYIVRGGGRAKLLLVTYPFPLQEQKLGDDEGYSYFKISHTSHIPVKSEYSGEVMDYRGLVHWDGNYIYFDGPGEAVIRRKSIDVNVVLVGNDAYVTISNTSDSKFSGSVTVPISGRGPSYCKRLGNSEVCSLHLDPFEKRVLVFKEVNSLDSGDNSVFPAVSVRGTEINTGNGVMSLEVEKKRSSAEYRSRIEQLISKMRDYYKRARQIGVEYLLSFDENTINTAESLTKSVRDPSVLSSLYFVLKDTVQGLERRAKYEVAALEGYTLDDAGTKSLEIARRSLASGDYVMALAIAESIRSRVKHSGGFDYVYLLFGISIVFLVILANKYSKKQKKKPIPWI